MIVFFLPNLQVGGAERVMLNLLLSYKNSYPNAEIVLLLFKKKGDLLREVPSEVSIYELNTSGATKSVVPFISFCNKQQPKVVFSSLGCCLTTSLAKPFLSNKTVIINRIGNTIGAEKLLFTNIIKRHLYLLANKIIAKMSDHVIFQCNYMKDDYLRETKVKPKKNSTIYNPVKIEHIKELATAQTNRSYTFVAVGRLSAQKDYETLLNACAILKQYKYKFSLAILGDGDLKQRLLQQIEKLNLVNEVYLIGTQSNPYSYIKNAQYLVSSSLYEGFSNVIIEALCLGKPVIATNCPGGNAEVIQNGENGWLCDTHNPEALANTMVIALKEDLSFLSEKIAIKCKGVFSDDVIFNQYEKVIANYII